MGEPRGNWREPQASGATSVWKINMTFTPDVAQVTESLNRFAWDLYSQLAAEQDGNLCFSPSGIALALALTSAGAAGETAQEIRNVLHTSLPDDRLHEALRFLQAETCTGGVEFRIASQVWMQSGYRILPDFIRTAESAYGATPTAVDFQGDLGGACREINRWVSEKTAGRIPSLVSPGSLDRMIRVVLTNAVYFLGSWEFPFEEDDTRDEEFRVTADESVPARMMRQCEYFLYAEDDACQLLTLPYRNSDRAHVELVDDVPTLVQAGTPGSDLQMVVILPREVEGLGALERRLAVEKTPIHRAMRGTRLDIWLPRFRIEIRAVLEDVLAKLGMKRAFSAEQADFSRMSEDPEGLFVSSIVHQAFVEVNEKGTEAAAASAICMLAGAESSEPDVPRVFRADRPFLFYIRDGRTRQIHFIGRVTNPRP